MNVKLISHSQISDKFVATEMDVQDLIAYCARVSNPANQSNTQTSEKLVRYLIKNKHWSPLEMVSACVEVNTTRDIARQLLRHRSFSFQEFSQRYADPVKELDFVTREARLQDTKNRQNSLSSSDEATKLWWENKQQEVIAMVTEMYKAALEKGIAKEQARAILPEGNTVSRLYVSGTLRSFIHYIEVRSGSGTQKEHMEIAREMAIVLAPIFPMIAEFVNIKNS
jgi:thymidylate synthase (FAD)